MIQPFIYKKSQFEKIVFFTWRPFWKSQIVSFRSKIELVMGQKWIQHPKIRLKRPHDNFYSKMLLEVWISDSMTWLKEQAIKISSRNPLLTFWLQSIMCMGVLAEYCQKCCNLSQKGPEPITILVVVKHTVTVFCLFNLC